VVVGGAGAVGSMLVRLLADAGVRVVVVDRVVPDEVPPTVVALVGDVQHPDARTATALAAADLVVLALPEPVALAVAQEMVSRMSFGMLLVHTLTVQSRIADLLADDERGVEVLGLNPLFAPSLGLPGRGVAAVEVHPGPRSAELLDLLARAGASIVSLDGIQHDRLMAAAQVLTHAAVLAFGLAMRDLGVDVGVLGALAPPPHRALLAMLARISGGTPEVYWDIQASNPFAGQARAALLGGIQSLSTAVASGERLAFERVLRDGTSVLGEELDGYRATSAVLLQALGSSAVVPSAVPEADGGLDPATAAPR